MSCPRCAELEERNAWLESELGIQRDEASYAIIRQAMQELQPPRGNDPGRRSAAKLILTLYRANGRPLSRAQLMDAIPPSHGRRSDERLDKIVDVWVCRARGAFGREAITTIWGRGYALTPVGQARIAALLSTNSQNEEARHAL